MEKEIIVFAVKPFSGNVFDSVDNVNRGVFGGSDNALNGRLLYYSEILGGPSASGTIKEVKLNSKNPLLRIFEKVRFMRSVSPDFIFGVGGIADLPYIFFRNKETKYCIVWHNVLSREMARSWGAKTPWWMRAFIFNSADCILTVSGFSAASIRQYFPEKKIDFILNGIDTGFFSPEKKNREYLTNKFGVDFSQPLVVNISALNARKRPELFVEVARGYSKANFLIVGRKVAPWDFITGTEDMKNFKWIPVMDRSDVAILLASADVFMLTSIDEPCAAAIQEAAASGLPQVISRTGGNPELISSGEQGVLVECNKDEVGGYTHALDGILSSKDLKGSLSRNARKKAEEQFSWSAVRERYFSYLEKNRNF